MAKARPDRIRLTLWDDKSGSTPIALPARRTWPIGIVFAIFFAIFASAAGSVVAGMSAHTVRGVFDLMFWLFNAFWLLGWSVGVFILGALTLLFLFYRESARIQGGRLVHVPQLGPLKIVCEYELARVSDIRIEPAKHEDKVRIRFDYGGGTNGLGDAMPRSEAEKILATLRTAAGDAAPRARREPRTADDLPPAQNAPAEPRAARQPIAASPGDARIFAPAVALVAANVLPLIGVGAFGWSLADVMVLYWAESAVIAFYTVLKICIVGKLGALAAVPFFVGHFGGFMAVHFLFVYGFFVRGFEALSAEPSAVDGLLAIFVPLWPALLGFAVSHGASFVANFVRGGEYNGLTVSEVMAAPYKRIVVMHLTIIFGGWLVMAFGTPVAALVLLVLIKTGADLRAHTKEHSKFRLRPLQPCPAR